MINSPKRRSQERKSAWDTFVLELCVFVFQIAVFFTVAALTSNLFDDQKRLLSVLQARVNVEIGREIIYTLAGNFIFLGMLYTAQIKVKLPFLREITRAVLDELPRTAYFFGSSVAGVLLGAACYQGLHPSAKSMTGTQLAGIGFSWAIVFFGYGFLAKLWTQQDIPSTALDPTAPNA